MTGVSEKALFQSNPLGSTTTLDEVRENFEFLDDWEERYGYVIDLGKQIPKMPDQYRIEDNYVHGCQSQVWFIHYFDPESNKLYLLVDSDAMIVRGLAAVVLTALSGKSPQDVAAFDMDKLFQDLDLLRHLSPTRGNGLRSMVQKIQTTAAGL